MSESLPHVAELIAGETGIVIKENQFASLAAAIARIAPGMDADSFLREQVNGAPALMARLVEEVTVQETYFFREERDLRALEWWEMVEASGEAGEDMVRIWVPGCATGEDAYTIAILATEALGPGRPPVEVLGTDISAAAIAAAERGEYRERSVRGVPERIREHYFVPGGSHHRLRENARSLVRFRRHNLVKDPFPPAGETAFDLIVCRNVLIYFDAETIERVVRSLESALRPDGELILGAADRLGAPSRGKPAGRVERRRPTAAPKPKLRRPLGLPGPAPKAHARADAGERPRRRLSDRIEEALWAADAGDLERTLELTALALEADPLNPDALFVRGLAELGREEPAAAVRSFRRALYVDPSFGLAAFELGRAHDAEGDEGAARRAYQRALHTLDRDDDRHDVILDQVDLGDVVDACRARLAPSGAVALT